MNHDFENYLSLIKKDSETVLTKEHLITGAIVNTKRIIIELQELESVILTEAHNNTFSLLILGSQLETLKRELIKIKQEYQKKW